ncbi:MAG: zinc-ribbon domain-containing protein [Gammaproteobacteria bacterium]|nr:zinc-ribbon domain-containing protein [Gammaproteobacteria bacterium]
MYTQCPDCSTAFRVTAEVLKQAAGKVRCGGCGNAFNALLYLSESLPEQAPAKEADAALPELKPEATPGGGLPRSISAEQSAALLKTLDELAGSDIRIEDTGVEWRVLDDDEIGMAAGEELVIDEILDESPTPVDQFLTETPAIVDSPEIFEEQPPEFSRTSVDELRFDDNTPLPEDFDVSDDGFVEGDFTAETLTREAVGEDVDVVAPEDPQVNLELSEPGEWTDILGEFEDLAEVVAATVGEEPTDAPQPEPGAKPAPEPELEADAEAELDTLEVRTDDDIDVPLDMDSQFALQAEAMGIDLSGMHETLDMEEDAPLEEEVDLDALLRGSKAANLELEDLLDEELVDEFEDEELVVSSDEATQLDLIDDEHDYELDEPDEETDNGPASEGHYIPPMTEEEQTINLQIDQDLLALAVEDEDGFASTIIIPGDAAEAQLTHGLDDENMPESFRNTGAGFETIIMEGDAFRSFEDFDEHEADQDESDKAAAAILAGVDAAEKEAQPASPSRRFHYGVIGGIVALILLLAVQYVHQSRETLATIPAFNNAVGPLYRAIGQPLSPAWDITGWSFEVAKGTEEEDASLTIYSRLGNQSDKPLPYPLIGISLTDRFEETIGSRVLDPADYLSNDLDPRKLVKPGNTFEAVITIPTPAETTAGFRLRACYRTTDGLLRCKDDGFK